MSIDHHNFTPFKIVMAGKGGVGKTTITALLARQLLQAGNDQLLVVDGDPAMTLHYSLLGQAAPSKPLHQIMESLDMSGAAVRQLPVSLNEYALQQVESEGVLTVQEIDGTRFRYVSMGRPQHAGCYCQINRVLSETVAAITQYPLLLVDSEAGLEHLSRRRFPEIDLLIVVALPTRASLSVAQETIQAIQQVGLVVHKTVLVINRAGDHIGQLDTSPYPHLSYPAELTNVVYVPDRLDDAAAIEEWGVGEVSRDRLDDLFAGIQPVTELVLHPQSA